jgi:hypothetical protein
LTQGLEADFRPFYEQAILWKGVTPYTFDHDGKIDGKRQGNLCRGTPKGALE